MIAIGCDHGAVELKNQMIEHLKKRGIECKDVGTYALETHCVAKFSSNACVANEINNQYSLFASVLERDRKSVV